MERRHGRVAGFIPNPKLKLLEQVSEVMRFKHYSIRTEQCYCEWVRRFMVFHRLRSREEMLPAEPKMEAFLSELATKGNVAVSTQNQTFNALLFVYREILRALRWDCGQATLSCGCR